MNTQVAAPAAMELSLSTTSAVPEVRLEGSWEFPRIGPGRTNAFIVTSNATDATPEFTYPPTWHTHAAS